MAGAIAHRFNNQLSVIIGHLELAIDILPSESPLRANLGEAMQAAKNSAEISAMMLTYLGQTSARLEPVDLAEFCDKHLAALEASLPSTISLATDWTRPGPVVKVSASHLRQVLNHLFTNAVEAVGTDPGQLRLAVTTMPAADLVNHRLTPVDWRAQGERCACLTLTDSGCGIAPEALDSLFDPFYTTKFTGRGLGLPVVLGIVRSWGGAIAVDSRLGQGTTFRVLLPLSDEPVQVVLKDQGPAKPMPAGGTVPLVEDQDMVLKVAETMLTQLGFRVAAAAGGRMALDLFRRALDDFCCVITDLTMPDMNGWETIAALRRVRPNIPIVLASGYDQADVMGGDRSERPQVFLHKPFPFADLKAALTFLHGASADRPS